MTTFTKTVLAITSLPILLALTVWAMLPSVADLRAVVRETRVVDAAGRVVSDDGSSLDALPEWILDDLAQAEGTGVLSLGAGIARYVQGKPGSAPIAFQVWKLLQDDEVPDTFWDDAVGVVGALKLTWAVAEADLVAHYARKAPFAPGAPGLAAAARSRYGVEPADLNRAQGLALISCAPRPTKCDERPRAVPFRSLVQEGIREGWIAAGEVDPEAPPAFVEDEDRTELPRTAGLNLSTRTARREARHVVPVGYDFEGATIETSLDFDWIQTVNRELDRTIENYPDATFASVALADPEGRVVIYAVRARSKGQFLDPPFDVLSSPRSRPASRLKPFAFTLLADDALEVRSPEEVLALEVPNVYVRPGDGVEIRGCGGVETATFAYSLEKSCNGSSLHVLGAIGPEAFTVFTADLGLDLAPRYDAVLGTQDVAPLALLEAYHTLFANDGVRAGLTFVDRVASGSGAVLFDLSEWARPGIRVVRPPAARLVRSALRGTAERGGTARRIRQRFPNLHQFEFALKTGSTEADSQYRVLGVTGVFRPPGHDWWTVTAQVEGRAVPAHLSGGAVAVPLLGRVLTALEHEGAWSEPRGRTSTRRASTARSVTR